MAQVKALVVWGWGWGWQSIGGGWGAWEFYYNPLLSITPWSHTITINNWWTWASTYPSTASTDGGTTIFGSLKTCAWWGWWWGYDWGGTWDGRTWASGGGWWWNWVANSGTASAWYAGGNWTTSTTWCAGGGWWSASVWANASASVAGNGWAGTQCDISWTNLYYAAWWWGGWFSFVTTIGIGGSWIWWNGGRSPDAWADSPTATAWAANTGSWWGGWWGSDAGANGAKGIVIISYASNWSDWVSPSSTGWTITTSGGQTIHTFTSNGTFTMVASSVITNSSFLAFM